MATNKWQMMRPRFIAGLDLGQTQDPSAFCLLEAYGDGDQAEYLCRSLHRWDLMTPYPTIVEDLKLIFLRAPFSTNSPRLAIDRTGVGAGVFDFFKQARLNASLRGITITAGNVVTPAPGGWNVPKRDLIAAAQVALQTDRLKIVDSLPEAEMLVTELKNYRVKITASGRDVYGNSTDSLDWRDPNAAHDDLVLALAVALWLDQRPGVTSGYAYGV